MPYVIAMKTEEKDTARFHLVTDRKFLRRLKAIAALRGETMTTYIVKVVSAAMADNERSRPC